MLFTPLTFTHWFTNINFRKRVILMYIIDNNSDFILFKKIIKTSIHYIPQDEQLYTTIISGD